MKSELFDLFPQRVVMHDCDCFYAYQSKLIDYSYQIRNELSEGVNYTIQREGYQSDDLRFRKDFIPFMPFINWNLQQCLYEYGFDIQKIKYQLEIIVINIGYPGSYHNSHIHPKCHISALLWLKTPENCGNLVFENNDVFSQVHIIENLNQDMRDKLKISSQYHFTPVEGRMLLFPPNLTHHVKMNESDSDRLSMVFNLSFL
jgi:uncharacterized protein (TIGR02466 family)